MTSGLWPVIRASRNGMPYRPAGGVFAVEGTVYPGAPFPPVPLTDDGNGWWAGFASGAIGGLINAADGLWYTECIGYPAITTPMWPSAQIGQHNLGSRVKQFADWYFSVWGVYPPIKVVAWSQGAIAADLWWSIDVLPETGYLHYLKDYIYTIYNYGDPLRTPGISHGNDFANLAPPGKLDGHTTGGIGGPQDLTEEQTDVISPLGRPTILSFNNKGDLYGTAPVGDDPWTSMPSVGKTEYSFFKVIMQPGFVDVVSVGGGLFRPIGSTEAAINAIKFFGAAGNAPHFHYWDAMTWVINDIIAVGQSLPHDIGY